MTLDAYDVILLMLLSSGENNRIDGRTTIQKIGYFACEALKIDNDYAPHFYGPYSPSIYYALKRLTALKLVVEEPTITSNERTMYSYLLTPTGKAYSEKLSRTHPNEHEKIKKIVAKVREIEGDKIDIISKVAKVHYLKKEQRGKITKKEITEHAKNLGWNIDESEVSRSLRMIKTISKS